MAGAVLAVVAVVFSSLSGKGTYLLSNSFCLY